VATTGAYGLPESLGVHLFQVWIADTRGESFDVGQDWMELGNQCLSFWIWAKEVTESAARAGHIEPDEDAMLDNVAWLVYDDPSLTLRGAIERTCGCFRRGSLYVASPDEIKNASDWLKKEVTGWLTRNGIKFYEGPHTIIPSTALQRALAQFKGKPDVHFAPDIPQDKLTNGRQSVCVPEKETISVLIDCTFFGSAKDCVLFGSRGIYYRNAGFEGFLPYCEFPNRTFNFTENDSEVSLGGGERLNLSGSQVNSIQLVSMLDLIKKEVATKAKQSKSSVGLGSIPGMVALKTQLMEDIVEVLRNPDEYRKYRISIPNGILFYGPPGCGKTFVAQRLAGELGYNFSEVSPGTIASPYIHDTVSKVRSIFEEAARSAPVVLFVDEFEGMVPSRRQLGPESQYKSEEVNEWLVQIGSCVERKILFIAATNEPWRIDEAIMRTGRLDKKVYIGPPDCEAIEEMLRFHLERRPLASADVPQTFAEQIRDQGYSASDLKALVDEAAKIAIRQHSAISIDHLQRAAVERVPPSISKEQEDLYLAFR
jgi:transitional endoplasmic reticulum ATPase